MQLWRSEDEDPQLESLRKKAVKVKHVKRREKKAEKKVSLSSAGGGVVHSVAAPFR